MPSQTWTWYSKKGSRVDTPNYWHARTWYLIAHFGVIWAELQCQVSPTSAIATPSLEWLVTQSFRFGLDASTVAPGAGWLPNTLSFWKVLAEVPIPAVRRALKNKCYGDR
ncbi:hypothetical protein PISMIDRAFT_670144 [Pisolithus microcarpus 441]|uniref:Uncharacterized protein n=1 Tax=Pisolithus microcarpus 441 TaxID=765257 RepID=A0A0D0AA59_9AGAM|nr:hypothetical protein PISMIDRAFT_670144 [Pisolithus microcarpus 441]